ncbi:Bona fide RidA/YjgF/TdcF/RutC subgroup [Minicystis rosea]|nr:Bona fide RidA/YjgF/TdcF/RutC subgroup [Minicystis rosea]
MMSEGSSRAGAAVQFVDVPDWPKPKGYQNGAVVTGRTLYVAGQVGWDAEHAFDPGFAKQFAQALDNVLTVVRAAGGTPESVVKMTIYVTDLPAYRAAQREIGALWRARFGKHFPVMALVGVAGLVEERALVEIETTCALGDAGGETR